MEDENNYSLIDTLKKFAQTFFTTIADVASLAGTEALLAGKSLINIFQLIVIMKILAIITWGCLCGALAIYIAALVHNWSIALLALAALNFIALMSAYLMQLHLKKNLSFPATRRQLQNSKDHYNEKSEMESKIS